MSSNTMTARYKRLNDRVLNLENNCAKLQKIIEKFDKNSRGWGTSKEGEEIESYDIDLIRLRNSQYLGPR